jgi:uncharacterized protein YggL (DUF469 family)
MTIQPRQLYSPRIYSWQLNQIPADDTTHDELMHAVSQYFLANMMWTTKGTKQAGLNVRYWLNEIAKISRKRRRVVSEWKAKISDKSQTDRSFKAETRKQREAKPR